MKAITKRRLKVYLPIMTAVLLIGVVIMVVLLANRVTAKDYFNALSKSQYSKQVQHTKIVENEMLIYEKLETIIFDGDNVYHSIYEKKLSADIEKDFEEINSEFYYSKTNMYYFEEGVWKSENFNISEKVKRYYLQTDYFSSFDFQKKIENEGKLFGSIKNDKVANVVGGINLKDMSLTLVVNKKFEIKTFEIQAKTLDERNISIINTYTYNNEEVNMPV